MIPAASRPYASDGDNNPSRLLRVDLTEIIIHVRAPLELPLAVTMLDPCISRVSQTLKSLCSIGIECAVLTLGHKGKEMAAAIESHTFVGMTVKFVWCDLTYSRGHASNLMIARSMFKHESFLVVMSGRLFELALLKKFNEQAVMLPGTDAVMASSHHAPCGIET